MSTKKYILPKLDDLELLLLLKAFRNQFEAEDAKAIVSIGLASGISINLDDDLDNYSGHFTIENANIACNLSKSINTNLQIIRNAADGPNVRVLLAQWTVGGSFNANDLQPFVQQFGAISSLLNTNVLVRNIPNDMSPESFNTALGALTAQHQQMMHSLHQSINEFEEKRNHWSEEQAKEKAQHAEELNRQKDEILEERRKLQLDSPRAERRRILEDFTKNAGHLAEDVSLGNQFIMVRFAVFAAAMVSGVLFAFIALSSIYSISGGSIKIFGFDFYVSTQSDLTQSYVMMGFLAFKSAISTAISIGSFLLGINWLKSLQNEEARNARMVSRFKRDLIRASWIIETVQEIRGSDGQGEIPDVWLDRATNGMFDNYGSEISQDGNDALKTLLSNSSKLSVGPDGITAEMGSKGAKNPAGEL